ncbi:hypothetical protein ABW38_22635, partial [Achromobacter xylosoxidans]
TFPRWKSHYAAMLAAAPASPGSSMAGDQQPARDWELTCHECDGSGHVYVKHQVAERKTDIQEFKEECECCEGRGFVFAFQDIPGIEEYVKTCRPAPAAGDALDVDTLANEIRRVDGNHTMGAGALAEALMPLIQKASAAALNSDTERLDFLAAHGAWVAWSRDRECCRVFHVDADGQDVPMCGWGDGKNWLTPRKAIDAAIAAQRKGDA